jgi:hypothetical protein
MMSRFVTGPPDELTWISYYGFRPQQSCQRRTSLLRHILQIIARICFRMQPYTFIFLPFHVVALPIRA